MPVLEVGTGVGYFVKALDDPMDAARACRLSGLGRPGEEDNGSKAGRRDVAGRFTPAARGSDGSRMLLPGGESIIAAAVSCQEMDNWACTEEVLGLAKFEGRARSRWVEIASEVRSFLSRYVASLPRV